MEVTKKLDPGAHGTKRFVARFGKQLACVRYGLDHRHQLRPSGNPHPNRLLTVKIGYQETRLRQRVKSSGGQWLPDKKLWQLPARKIRELGLEKRIVDAN